MVQNAAEASAAKEPAEDEAVPALKSKKAKAAVEEVPVVKEEDAVSSKKSKKS